MLVISRRVNEGILLGDDIRVTVVEARPDLARIGIEAPRSVPVLRQELADEVRRRNVAASRIRSDDLAELTRRLGAAGVSGSLALPVHDRERSATFYAGVFDFRREPPPAGSRAVAGAVRMHREGTTLWLLEGEAAGGGAILVLPVPDPRSARERALASGGSPWETPPPGEVGVADPDGHRILLLPG